MLGNTNFMILSQSVMFGMLDTGMRWGELWENSNVRAPNLPPPIHSEPWYFYSSCETLMCPGLRTHRHLNSFSLIVRQMNYSQGGCFNDLAMVMFAWMCSVPAFCVSRTSEWIKIRVKVQTQIITLGSYPRGRQRNCTWGAKASFSSKFLWQDLTPNKSSYFELISAPSPSKKKTQTPNKQS